MFDEKEEFSLPKLEEKVLKFWKKEEIFKKSIQKNEESKKKYVFFEGPPTANGRPGIHHVLARSFKDLMPRYKTMRGFSVPRKAGWDTHGLPVEIQAEKELGLKNKKEIEKYGIDRFNEYCKELVWRYRQEFEDVTERMGFWIDLKNPYVTYENSYMESVWWILSQVHKRKLLRKLYKVVPWCSRCQTPLSSHEIGQPGAYQDVEDNSVYIKFKRAKTKKGEVPEYFLAWTTTAWSIPGVIFLVVNPKVTYKKFAVINEKTNKTVEYLYAYNEPPALTGFRLEMTEKISASQLIGLEYEPAYKLQKPMQAELTKAGKEKGITQFNRIRSATYVSTEDGTGIVTTAPAFGEEDFGVVGLNDGLPVTLADDGKMIPGFPGAGKFFKTAEVEIIKDLQKRNLLHAIKPFSHSYPHCWRCSTPIAYMARRSWFIEMSKLKKEMIINNGSINWTPKHIKTGRFGQWLADLKDWSISRNRYWGTPLPAWECTKKGCESVCVVGGMPDLYDRRISTNTFFAVRHGEAQHNIDGVIASGPERKNTTSHLTPQGEKRAQEIGKKLQKEKIDLIFTSPYARTKKTAAIIAKATKAKVLEDKRLGEWNTGIFAWKKHEIFQKQFASPAEKFTKTLEGAENLSDMKKRALDFVLEIDKKYKNKKILIVSHADVVWILEGALRGLTKPEELNQSGYYPTHENYDYKELKAPHLPYTKNGDFDLHRPYIDSLELRCKKCSGNMKRVKDVIDVWFDSGSMPFAQHHFPFAQSAGVKPPTTPEKLAPLYKKIDFPADYISEAVDQTRGWFYTLLAISTLLERGVPYKNVVCLGLVHDKKGIKMSKSKGNIVLPIETMNLYGADAVRWYFYTMNHPGDAKNFNEEDLSKVVRRLVMIVYNTYIFWKTYGSFEIERKGVHKPKQALDRWIMSRAAMLSVEVSKKLDKYEMGEAGVLIETFVADLSRWYVRRSRPRFQDAARGNVQMEQDWVEASLTLQIVLETLAKIMAPFMPFFSEGLYLSLGGGKASVHLEDWPEFKAVDIDDELIKDMEVVREIATKALALRAQHGLKVRQPLTSLTIKNTQLKGKKELLEILMDEVNVKAIKFSGTLKTEEGLALDTELTKSLIEEGIIRELARAIQSLRADAKYHMSDEIVLLIAAPEDFSSLVQRLNLDLKRMVNAKSIELHIGEKHDAYKKTKIKDWEIELAVRKL